MSVTTLVIHAGPVLLAGAEMVRPVKAYRSEINDSSTQLFK
jgi:hypothetical protein